MATTNLVKTINENEIVFADGEVETFENIDQLANYALDNYLDVRKFTEATPIYYRPQSCYLRPHSSQLQLRARRNSGRF